MKIINFLLLIICFFAIFISCDNKNNSQQTDISYDTGVIISDTDLSDNKSVEMISSEYPDYTYIVNDNYAEIVFYNGFDSDIIIPDVIDGYTVKAIKEEAFYHKTKIKSIVLPNYIKKLENGCFYKCISLESITIPSSLTDIGTNPFFRATSLESIIVEEDNLFFCDIDGVLYSKDKTKLFVYPEGKKAESYSVPNGVIEIKGDAFGYRPVFLKQLILPDSLKSMQTSFVYPEDIVFIIQNNDQIRDQLIENGLTVKYQ